MGEKDVSTPELLPINGRIYNNLADMMPVYDNVAARLKQDGAAIYRVFLATRVMSCFYSITPLEQKTLLIVGIHNAVSKGHDKKDNLAKVSGLFSGFDTVELSQAVHGFIEPNREVGVFVDHFRLLMGIGNRPVVTDNKGERRKAINNEKLKQAELLNAVKNGFRYEEIGIRSNIDDKPDAKVRHEALLLDTQIRYVALMLDIVTAPRDVREGKAAKLNMNLLQVQGELIKIGLSEEEADIVMRQEGLTAKQPTSSNESEKNSEDLENIPLTRNAFEAIERIRMQGETMVAAHVPDQLSVSFDGTAGQFDEQIDKIFAEIGQLKPIRQGESYVYNHNSPEVRRVKAAITNVLASQPMPDFSSIHRLTQGTNKVRLLHDTFYRKRKDEFMFIAEALRLFGVNLAFINPENTRQVKGAFVEFVNKAGIPYFTCIRSAVFIRKYMEKFKELMDIASAEEKK